MSMVAIEAHEDFRVFFGNFVDLPYDFGRDAGALDHLNARCERMGFNRLSVVRSNINIKTEGFSFRNTWVKGLLFFDRLTEVEQCKHRGTEDQRTSMGNAGFNNQIRFYLPNNFLHGSHVLRILNDRSAKPFEIVGILRQEGFGHEELTCFFKDFVFAVVGDSLRFFF